jgi:hypothetical protein
MTTHSIKKLPVHLIWIFGLLEMITVPLVAWLPQVSSLQTKSPWQGALVGFIGVALLFLIVNKTIARLSLQIDSEPVLKISILPAALWNMLLLALIFGLQKIVGLFGIESWILRYVLAGFISVFGAVWITFTGYGISYQYVGPLRISIKTNQHRYSVKKVSVVMLALLGGVYEAIALPLILLWQKAESNVPLIAAITGLAGGIIGCSIIVSLYNRLDTPRLVFILEKKHARSLPDFHLL